MNTIQKILNAKTPEEVFGVTGIINLQALKLKYRQLRIEVHPDKHGDSDDAKDAFSLLSQLFERAEYKLKKGTYGNANALSSTVNIVSKRGEYSIVDLIAEGDLANIYTALDKNSHPVAVKVTRSPANNDLTRSEASTIKTIVEANEGLPALAHIPKLQDSFTLRQDGLQKHVNVYNHMDTDDGWCSMQDVLNSYPDGIDLRDAAWMFNRLLAAILMAHQAGVVHAAIVPSHFMLHLPTHGGVLIDWSYAVKNGSTAKAIFPEMQEFMPPEVLKKQPLTFGTDIYMAANVLLALVGGGPNLPEYPPKVRGLFRACQLAPTKRLTNVTEVYEDFSDILKVLYGPRTFRPFTLKE